MRHNVSHAVTNAVSHAAPDQTRPEFLSNGCLSSSGDAVVDWHEWQQSQRWEAPAAAVNLGASTVERVETRDKPDPTFKRRPVGFTARIEPVEPDEGDQA